MYAVLEGLGMKTWADLLGGGGVRGGVKPLLESL
jgi:hypothetical protein